MDLDEVDLSLLDLIGYVRALGVSPDQVEHLLRDRLEMAFDISDAYEDSAALISMIERAARHV